MALIDLVSTDLAGVILSSAPAAAAEVAQNTEAEFFGSGHLIALILMPLIAVIASAFAGVAIMKAVPDSH